MHDVASSVPCYRYVSFQPEAFRSRLVHVLLRAGSWRSDGVVAPFCCYYFFALGCCMGVDTACVHLRATSGGGDGAAGTCDVNLLQDTCDGFQRVVYASGVTGVFTTFTLVRCRRASQGNGTVLTHPGLFGWILCVVCPLQFVLSVRGCITMRYWKRPRLWRSTMLTGKTGVAGADTNKT